MTDTLKPCVSCQANQQKTDNIIEIEGNSYYRIAHYDQLRPFLISIVSDADHWQYVSSNGGLTAGRGNENQSLFPYETDDKLHVCHPYTGPVTLIRVRQQDHDTLWQPFAETADLKICERNIYKSVLGNSLIFEEINHVLGLCFRYQWNNSDQYGFVRTSTLTNFSGNKLVNADIIDGILNILPSGISLEMQQRFSCLVNAYTRCDVDDETGMAIVALSAAIVDHAVAAEALKATVVWSQGLENPTALLTGDQLNAFRHGRDVTAETELKGRRSSYLLHSTVILEAKESRRWRVVADVMRTQAQIEQIRHMLVHHPEQIDAQISNDIAKGGEQIRRYVAATDGLQCTGDQKTSLHHLTNVLFNDMRGGLFADQYCAPGKDIATFIRSRNAEAFGRHAEKLHALPERVNVPQFIADAEKTGDADLIRLAMEYLPITFSRRHGDPSRPWNRFDIKLKNADGSPILNYQGNWRDIFQNWEALTQSYPEFIPSIIAKFLNASTLDGFNPYRITRDGIDWEIPAPDDPWGGYGYWGDHQIVYLLKFLESSCRYQPGMLKSLLSSRRFSYAHVPYRLRPYAEIVKNPHETIDFDRLLHKSIEQRVASWGSDGKLVCDQHGHVVHVSLAEKLLVPALSKLSNFVLDGGIWMNTLRPEWNDANNALVGYGISMVTLCYLRRYAEFCAKLFCDAKEAELPISREVREWFVRTAAIFAQYRPLLTQRGISDAQRREMLDTLGASFGDYRTKIYATGITEHTTVRSTDIVSFFLMARDFLDHAIVANKRHDGLYHAYNLLNFPNDREASVAHLYEMLEGQVAVLSSGCLSPEQSQELINALFKSAMYRADQNSFMLYPKWQLPSFLGKNIMPEQDVTENKLLCTLLADGETSLIIRDVAGHYRFAAELQTLQDLRKVLNKLSAKTRYAELVAQCSEQTISTYERVFGTRAFTGRSGTMYGYEGLGCIYWHMVAKLLLAVQENAMRAAQDQSPKAAELVMNYYRVRAGLGFNKTAAQYGAFPLDPYSHTPGHSGAQQPGMTGQVKEEILTRLAELGLCVEQGKIHIRPTLLRKDEFLTRPTAWQYIDAAGNKQMMNLPAGSCALTFCQVAFVHRLCDDQASIKVIRTDGRTEIFRELQIEAQTSGEIMRRNGEIARIEIMIPEKMLCQAS